MPAPDQLVGDLVLAVADETLPACIEVDQYDGSTFAAHDSGELFEELRIRLVDPDVDLAATGQPDAQRQVVGDSVGQQARPASREDLAGSLDDLALDAAAGHGTGELALL